jgi:hypothetical protein
LRFADETAEIVRVSAVASTMGSPRHALVNRIRGSRPVVEARPQRLPGLQAYVDPSGNHPGLAAPGATSRPPARTRLSDLRWFRVEPRDVCIPSRAVPGDGCLSPHRRGVYRLRIVLDQRYPGIIEACAQAMGAIRPSASMSVGKFKRVGCIEVSGYWKHWPCLFPQHGSGRKHERTIELRSWQREISTAEPAALLRGLIHSDGYRGLNWVNGKGYPRYQFKNESADIRAIFCQALADYGVTWRRMNRNTISVARAGDVARLDEVIGPKA